MVLHSHNLIMCLQVRWNGCYAAVNILNNDVIFPQLMPRLVSDDFEQYSHIKFFCKKIELQFTAGSGLGLQMLI